MPRVIRATVDEPGFPSPARSEKVEYALSQNVREPFKNMVFRGECEVSCLTALFAHS